MTLPTSLQLLGTGLIFFFFFENEASQHKSHKRLHTCPSASCGAADDVSKTAELESERLTTRDGVFNKRQVAEKKYQTDNWLEQKSTRVFKVWSETLIAFRFWRCLHMPRRRNAFLFHPVFYLCPCYKVCVCVCVHWLIVQTGPWDPSNFYFNSLFTKQ